MQSRLRRVLQTDNPRTIRSPFAGILDVTALALTACQGPETTGWLGTDEVRPQCMRRRNVNRPGGELMLIPSHPLPDTYC